MFSLNHFKKLGNKVALLDENSNYLTYNNLACQFNFVKKKNFFTKNFISIFISENSINSYELYIYLMFSKSKTLILNSKNFEEYLNLACKKFRPSNIFIPKKFFKKKFLFNKKYYIYDTYKSYLVLKTKKKFDFSINRQIAVLLFTSGSAGNPKYVCLSYENILSNAKSILKYLNIKTTDKVITTLDLSYSYGMSILNSHLLGGSQIFVNKFTFLDKDFWKIYNKKNINFFYGVPIMFKFLFNKKNNFFKTTKVLACAGGNLESNIKKKILSQLKKKQSFFIMYGQTEASPRMTYINLSKNKSKLSSVGKPISNGKIFIKKNNKIVKRPFVNGEIVYKGKNVMLYYAKNFKSLTKKRKNNYLIKTGDIGYLDKEKFLYISGRVNRMVKINGVRLELDDIEKKFKSYNIICLNHNNKLYIFSKKKKNEVIKKISHIYNISLNNIVFLKINKIPINSNNKINYMELKNLINE